MKFVGQTEVAAFLAVSPGYEDAVRAWLAEMKYGQWLSAAALTADFQNVDTSELPSVVFYLAPAALRIETIIDFRVGIVLLVAISPLAAVQGSPQYSWNARRDH